MAADFEPEIEAQEELNKETPKGKKPQKGKPNLLNGPIDSTLIAFAVPMTVSFLINMAYALIDTFFVSRLGASAIAAIGFGEQIAFFVFTFGSGFALGTGIIVARRFGERNIEGARMAASQAVIFMIGFSTILMVILLIVIPKFVAAFSLPPDVSRYATLYLSALVLGVPGNFLLFQINAIMRSTGNAMFPLIIIVSTAFLNALFAPFLIFDNVPLFLKGVEWMPQITLPGLGLGMTGAGLATSTAQILGAIIALVGFAKSDLRFKISKETLKMDREMLGKIIRLGIPSSMQMFAVSISRMGIFKIAGTFGTTALTAYTLGLRVDLFVFMFVFATGIAVEIATGQNLGAGNIKRIFLYHRAAIKWLTGIMFVLAIAVFFGGGKFASLFTSDPAIIQATSNYLHITVFAYVFFSIGVISARVISGAGAAFQSMYIVGGSLLFIQVPVAYVLSKFTPLGQKGIWVGIAVSYVIFAIIAYVQMQGRRWMKARV
jgi:putative MATE family efflux protein